MKSTVRFFRARRISTPIFVCACAVLLGLGSFRLSAATVVVPADYASSEALGTANSPVSTATRTLLYQYASTTLGGLKVGDTITGLRWRANSAVAGSTAAYVNSAYTIVLAEANNSISSLSTTFANNLKSPVTVFSGALSIPAAAFSTGGSPNSFSTYTISFSTSYTYKGGDLVLYVSHAAGNANIQLDHLSSISPNIDTGYSAGAVNGLLATTAGASTASVTTAPVVVTLFEYTPAPAPEINVTGNGNTITDGDTSPSTTDNTDFGTVNVGSSTTKSFVIQNTGDATLNISSMALSGANSGDYSITSGNVATGIVASASHTIQVQFSPTAAGARNATLTINSDDSDEAAYDFSLTGTGQSAGTTLTAGDIAFTGYNSDGAPGGSEDDFSFMLLKDITTGTTISFTDCGWSDSTGFFNEIANSESTITWTAASAMTAGTQVRILGLTASAGTVTGAGLSLTIAGDQIFAFQGTRGSPTFISGIHANLTTTAPITSASDWDSTTATGTATSALPNSLTDGVNAIALFIGGTESDNAIYNGPVTGTASALRASINNRANWLFNDTTPYTLPPPLAAPEINVTGNGNTITDGDTSPSTTDNTDFGTVNVGSSTTKSFVIQNTGSATLNISSMALSGANSGDYSITSGNVATGIVASASHTIQVQFSPTAAGARNATLTINSDDSDEAAYDFSLTGTGQSANTAPTAISPTSGAVSAFDSANSAIGVLFATDAEDSTFTYSITAVKDPSNQNVSNANGAVFDLGTSGSSSSATGVATATLRAVTPSSLSVGNYTVTVQADDGHGGTFSQDVTVTVSSSLVVDVTAIDSSAVDGAYANDAADGGGLDLKEALYYANNASGNITIVFASTLSGTITLPGSLTVRDGVTFLMDSDTDGRSLTISSSSFALGGSLTVNVAIGDTLTIGSVLAGTGSTLTKSGAGTLTLSGSNTYTGTTTVSGGTLSVAGDANLGSGALTLDGGTLTVTGAGTIDNAFVMGASGGTISHTSAVTLSGVISGSGNLTKSGAGALTLSGSNTYSGTTTISAGTLKVASDSNLGTGAITLSGTLFASANCTIDNDIVLSGTGTFDMVNGSTIITVSGVISGSGNLAKAGTGRLDLSGNNTYAGTTTVSTGYLVALHDNALGDTSTGTTVPSGGTLRIGPGVTVAESLTVGGLGQSSNGALQVSSGTGTVTGTVTLTSDIRVLSLGTLVLNGAIGGSGGVDKLGTGTLTLSGVNPYTGNTAVTAGVLLVNGSIGNGTVTVASGATLGGTGTIGGPVSVSSGGTLSPGAGGPGALSTGNLTIASGATLTAQINGTTAGTDYDQVNVTGTVDITGATLSTTLGYTPTQGDVYTIIANDGSDAITGTFSGLAEGGTKTLGAYDAPASYVGGDGNDFTLTPQLNNTPTDITLSPASINLSAMSAGATVGTLTTTDADSGDMHTYSFATGTGDTDNGSFALAGDTLKIGGSVLAKGTYAVRIKTDDGNGGTFEKALTVTVVDNIPPTVVSILRKTPATQLTKTTPVVYEVTFSEPVANVATSSFAVAAVNGSGIVGSVTGVTGGPIVYDVTVNVTSGQGEFKLTVPSTGP